MTIHLLWMSILLSKYLNRMNFASCEVCPTLHEEIKSLKFKLEQDFKDPMIFAMNSKYKRTRFRRPYRKTLMFKNNHDSSKFHGHNVSCHKNHNMVPKMSIWGLVAAMWFLDAVYMVWQMKPLFIILFNVHLLLDFRISYLLCNITCFIITSFKTYCNMWIGLVVAKSQILLLLSIIFTPIGVLDHASTRG